MRIPFLPLTVLSMGVSVFPLNSWKEVSIVRSVWDEKGRNKDKKISQLLQFTDHLTYQGAWRTFNKVMVGSVNRT